LFAAALSAWVATQDFQSNGSMFLKGCHCFSSALSKVQAESNQCNQN
jgi:hypothetical protein